MRTHILHHLVFSLEHRYILTKILLLTVDDDLHESVNVLLVDLVLQASFLSSVALPNLPSTEYSVHFCSKISNDFFEPIFLFFLFSFNSLSSRLNMTGAGEGPILIKQLAACDKTTRDRAVRSLLDTWLPSQTRVTDEEMKKLWKGLFYCVWHADKLSVQSDLIEKLSSVLPKLEPGLSIHYFSVFILTMRREWNGIDKQRLDKFYLLIRRFLNCFFAMLKKFSWDLDFTRRWISVLVDGTFLSDDKFHGIGVNYHISSVFLEETRTFLPVKKEVAEVLLEPFVGIMGNVGDKVLVGKIRSNVFDVFVNMGRRLLEIKRSGDEVDEGDDMFVYGTISLVMGFSTKFYELGSSVDCCQGNRKIVLGLHEEFSKLEKHLVSLGVDISIPDGNGNEGMKKMKYLS